MGLISNSRFGRLLATVKKGFSRLASRLSYDFWDEMQNNEIAKSKRPGEAAVKWYVEKYQKNPDFHIKRKIPQPGSLIIFDYKTPKYADTLDFWDKNPLVLCLTSFITKDEKIRVLGINLHLLPPKIRQLVLYQVFHIYKKDYTAQLFSDRDALQVNVRWQDVKSQLFKYGAGFGVRLYIPHLMTNTVEFRAEDWKYAIHIPSSGYAKTSVMELERLYREYVKAQGNKVRTGGASHL